MMVLVPELIQTFSDPTLELENSKKRWNVQFQSWIWKCPAADRNFGKFYQNLGKNLDFCSVKTAPYGSQMRCNKLY